MLWNNQLESENCIIKLFNQKWTNGKTFWWPCQQLSNKTSEKLHASARICQDIKVRAWWIFKRTFITSQFSCIAVWMFHIRNMEHRIYKIHKTALQVLHKNSHDLIFKELLVKLDQLGNSHFVRTQNFLKH